MPEYSEAECCGVAVRAELIIESAESFPVLVGEAECFPVVLGFKRALE